MIIAGTLTPEQQARSRRNYLFFNAMNGFSYMCVGDTVIILLAVRLDCPNSFIAILGSMVYFGYLLLPLGKVVTARVGAAQSQSTFWILRNGAALTVGTTPILSVLGYHQAALTVMMTGAFLFYGFRAAGVIMGQPLIGEITTQENRASFLGFSTGLFQLTGMVSLILITVLLRLWDNVWVLSALILLGSSTGIGSSRFLRRIDETDKLRESARKPIFSEMQLAWRNPFFRSQLLTGFVLNLSGILTGPIGMLTLKRGYGVSDTKALLFTLAQFALSVVMSQLMGKISGKLGPRRVVVTGFGIQISLCLFWIFAPAEFHWQYVLCPFLIGSGVGICIGNAMTHYFLQTVPVKNRVASSMTLAVATGAGAGVAGMVLAGTLVKWAGVIAGLEGLGLYRLYFGAVLIFLLIPGFFLVRTLPAPHRKS